MLETGFGVKGIVSTGYCGRDKLSQYGGLNVGTRGMNRGFRALL